MAQEIVVRFKGDASHLNRSLQKVNRGLSRFNTNAKGIQKGLQGVENRAAGAASSLRLAVGALAAFATGGFIKSIVDVTSRYQDLQTTLNTVAGSASKGAEAFKFVQEFATKTQFGIEELTQTYIKLQSSGITPTEELLTTFTDAAAVTTDQLGSLQAITDLFSRTTAGGLGLEELNRLADRGIPVFDILQTKLGKNRLELSEVGKSAEGANLILKALIDGINERFGGATQSRINNISTQFSNLSIAIDGAKNAVGSQGLAAALGETAVEITNLFAKNEDLVQSIGLGLTKAFLYAKEAGKFLIKNIELIGKAFLLLIGIKVALFMAGIAKAIYLIALPALLALGKGIKSAASLLLMLIPGGALVRGVVGGIAALATAWGLYEVATSDAAEESLNTLTNLDKVLAGLGIQGMDELRQGLENVSAEAARLQDSLKNVDDKTKDINLKTEKTVTNYESQAEELGKVKKTFNEILLSAEQSLNTAKATVIQDEIQRKLFEAKVALNRELTSEEKAKLVVLYRQNKEYERQAALAGRIESQANSLLKTTIDFAEEEGRILEKARDRALDLLQERHDQGLSSEGAYQASRLDIMNQFAMQELDINKRLQDQKFAYTEAVLKKEIAANVEKSRYIQQQGSNSLAQQIGQQEKIQEITNERFEFEKKSDLEKTQFALEQGGKIFDALGAQNKKAFQLAKAFNIANAIMNTYMGATKALATYPPPFNFIAAAGVVAMGLAQVSAIRSQSYSGRALGGPVMGGQSYIVGENGAEMFTPSTTGSITRNGDLQQQRPVEITFNINAIDTQSIDELLVERRSVITQVVSDAMLESGQRSRF